MSKSLLLVGAALALSGAGLYVATSDPFATLFERAPEEKAAAVPAAAIAVAPELAPSATLRVLFVGNSLTTTHDLPKMIEKLASAAGEGRRFEFQVEAFGGFSLAEHLVANRVAGLLAREVWEAVVLQEQGQRPGWVERRANDFFAAVRAFDAAIKNARARTVLYETYARREGDPALYPGDSYEAMQSRVNEGYREIGRAVGAEVVPVGHAFAAALRRHPEIRVWASDGQHPSLAGSYLAACVFYARLYGKSPLGNKYLAGLDPLDATLLQQTAALIALHGDPDQALAALQPAPAPASALAAPVAQPATSQPATSVPPLDSRFATEQDRLRHERIEADMAARGRARQRERVAITMYRTAWCPACKQASAYLKSSGLNWTELDIDQNTNARAAARRLNPRGSVPTIDVDGQVLVGWSKARFEKLVDNAAGLRVR